MRAKTTSLAEEGRSVGRSYPVGVEVRVSGQSIQRLKIRAERDPKAADVGMASDRLKEAEGYALGKESGIDAKIDEWRRGADRRRRWSDVGLTGGRKHNRERKGEREREGETKAVERRWEQLNAELMCPIKHPILQTWQIVLP